MHDQASQQSVPAVATITESVRERIRREGIDLLHSSDRADRYVREAVRDYAERSLGGGMPMLGDEEAATASVIAALTGFGPLQPFFDDPEVEEIWVNDGSRVFIARRGVSTEVAVRITPRELTDLVERMLATTGRRIDLSTPFVDASLPDGSRLHVASSEVSRGLSVNIRKFIARVDSLASLVDRATLTEPAARFLQASVVAGCSILVSGATHTGKTTMLNSLLGATSDTERVVTVEETFELRPRVRDCVALQCRQASLEGTGEITLRRLVKESLRMRPDRLVVGEVREAEALDLLIALNSGIAGMCTIHANSSRDALLKLSTLPLLAGRNIDAGFVVPTIAASLDIAVHLRIDERGNRRVDHIVALTGTVTETGRVGTVDLFTTEGDELRGTGAMPPKKTKFDRHGISPRQWIRSA
ncbi:MAG TPA: Flp pilus assembly complex ATPase component TadA [Candidatus Agrococcus pullicola]|uniref:Flp pilus assembly complex ATPase component TadA n=1 Tax=Candidatus Agrococcus pullicola TaxID=2838429 RepID=A0A9D1YUM7_9MICO|nr:Flp pilus assembly complex ATPase component TadA [Candidatus Agrococcus pullicola]